MIRYFDGEFSSWTEYIKEIQRVSYRNNRDDNINKFEGGFLVPQYMPVDKPGLHAWLFRFIGRLIHRENIYSKGVEIVDIYKVMKETMEIEGKKWKIETY